MVKVKKLTESEFLSQVIKLAAFYGWRVAHFRPAMNARGQWMTPVQGHGKGFPDLFLCHPKWKKVLFAELKVGKGRTSDDQWQWFYDLNDAGCFATIWRPDDWPEIERILKGE